MVDKYSKYYMKSTYESKCYGNENYTNYERKLTVVGNDKHEVEVAAPSIKRKVMPWVMEILILKALFLQKEIIAA